MAYESDYYTTAYLVLEGVDKGMIPDAASEFTIALVGIMGKAGVGKTIVKLPFKSLFASEDSETQYGGESSVPVDVTGGPKTSPASSTQAAGTTPKPTSAGGPSMPMLPKSTY